MGTAILKATEVIGRS